MAGKADWVNGIADGVEGTSGSCVLYDGSDPSAGTNPVPGGETGSCIDPMGGASP